MAATTANLRNVSGPKRAEPSRTDDLDRSDELREWYSEDERHAAAERNGEHPDDPRPGKPAPGDTAVTDVTALQQPHVQAATAELLDDIKTYLARFVVYPSEHELNAHALWIGHAWLMDCWESTPRIAFLSHLSLVLGSRAHSRLRSP